MNKKLLYISIVLYLTIFSCASYGDIKTISMRAQRAYSENTGDDVVTKIFSSTSEQLELKIVPAILSFENAPSIARGTINKVLGVDSLSFGSFYDKGRKSLIAIKPDYSKTVAYIVQYPEDGFIVKTPSEAYLFVTATKNGESELRIHTNGKVPYNAKELLDAIGKVQALPSN